jgi:hypothetical protein
MALLMPLISLICFAAFIWLVVVAFKNSTLWGVLVLLFSPITAIVFAIKCWEEAKKPFLLYIGSSAAALAVVLIFMASLAAPMVKMAQQMESGEVTPDQAADFIEDTMDRMEDSGMLSAQEKADLRKMKGQLREIREEPEAETAAEPAVGREADPDPLSAALATADTLETSGRGRQVATDVPASEPSTVSTTRITRSRDTISVRDIDDFAGRKMQVFMADGAEFTGVYIGRSESDLHFSRRLSSGTLDVFVGVEEVESLRLVKNR